MRQPASSLYMGSVMTGKYSWAPSWGFIFFVIMTLSDYYLTLLGKGLMSGFRELNPLVPIESPTRMLMLKLASVLLAYVGLVYVSKSPHKRYHIAIMWTFGFIFLSVNVLSIIQLVEGPQ